MLLKFGVAMAGVLALPMAYGPRITRALSTTPRIPLVWLSGLACGGDTEALLQSASPTTADLLINTLSVDYHEGLSGASGADAIKTLYDTLSQFRNGYIAVIEGAVPTADDAIYLTVGGRTFRELVAAVSDGAIGTIAVGSCAFDGGAAAAAGGSTGAVGAGGVITASRVVNLPGCPVNAANLAATLVHYFTFKEFPATDGMRRPLFAYGGLVHNQCERRAHFEFGEFVAAWGDEGAQKGWCLYKMGCKGPETFANCPTVKYADGASWSVLAGHGCIGCTMPAFWDAMGSAYARLPAPVPFLPGVSADQIGIALVGGVGGLAVAHGAASIVRQKVLARLDRPKAPREPAPEEPAPQEQAPEVPTEQAVAELPTEATAHVTEGTIDLPTAGDDGSASEPIEAAELAPVEVPAEVPALDAAASEEE